MWSCSSSVPWQGKNHYNDWPCSPLFLEFGQLQAMAGSWQLPGQQEQFQEAITIICLSSHLEELGCYCSCLSVQGLWPLLGHHHFEVLLMVHKPSNATLKSQVHWLQKDCLCTSTSVCLQTKVSPWVTTTEIDGKSAQRVKKITECMSSRISFQA